MGNYSFKEIGKTTFNAVFLAVAIDNADVIQVLMKSEGIIAFDERLPILNNEQDVKIIKNIVKTSCISPVSALFAVTTADYTLLPLH